MFLKKLLILFTVTCFLTAFTAFQARSQACVTLGQTTTTAFPVCGSDTFIQKSVPACANGVVPTPCPANGNVYEDVNPYWYKFTCFKSGSLGLTIQPNDLDDDYDWQIFDITGHNPGDVYSDPSLFLACNWSGLHGITGTSASAASLTECGSFNTTNPPIFSKMPNLIQGHNYLLMISHFLGDSQSGYKLSFGGGTASITDTVQPALRAAVASCDAMRITVVLNKRMKCSSVAADGSDFSLSPSTAPIIAASGNSCSTTGFDMDSVTLTLNSKLTPGNYVLTAQNGTDGNTLLDNCGSAVPVGAQLSFSYQPSQPTPLDSLTPPHCAPSVLQLVFSRGIHCSSISADGSDFTVTGTSPVTVIGASGVCDADGESSVILVRLAAPIVTAGTYQITLAPGSDGNTIIDECGNATPRGQTLTFTTKDTVSAAFDDNILFGCRDDTIMFDNAGKNGINKWEWIFDQTDTSFTQDPQHIYSVFNTKSVELIVSNGFCSDTASKSILLNNAIKAAFEGPNITCPKDAAVFKNNSTGNIVDWIWDFGDGSGSSFQSPPDHLFPLTGIETKYGVTLIIQDSLGCRDTATQQIDVLRSCYIAVPSAFTPNGDGVNDYLYPLNAYKADDLDFRVYNRYGQLVFETRVWTGKWDGRIGGQPSPSGTFVWTLQYTDRDTQKKFFLKGTSILIR